MATLLMLASNVEPAAVLPTLGLLGHRVTSLPLDPGALLDAPTVDCILVDARTDLLAARTTTRLLRTTGASAGVVAVVTEGGLAAVAPDWGVDDVVLTSAGPAEVELRIRLAAARAASADATAYEAQIRAGDLMIDESTYQARIGSEPLDLTFKEFELLKFLAMHPGRVFTRAQLLQEVWGYDYFGGTRTVDVHVRRLRAKLGPERESLIGTVRNVGYKFVEKPVDPFPPAPIAPVTEDAVTEDAAIEAAPLDTAPTTPV